MGGPKRGTTGYKSSTTTTKISETKTP